MAFEVIPALDLRGGRCVRLYQGDFQQETVFSEDPVEVAQRWAAQGAPRLHIVDLDGAARGEPVNLSIIRRINAAVACPLQVGGGLRELAVLRRLLDYGIPRVVLGTSAVREPSLVREACRRFGEAVLVSVDAREGLVAVQGWQERTGIEAIELARGLADLGVRRLIYTDIARDGTLSAPNFPALERLLATVSLPVIAAGGVTTLEHLERLRSLGCEGAIVGRALYTGSLDLRAALEKLGGGLSPGAPASS
ncbi:MAG: 1-(5-phosphoribosyl)-5-[(5-phosphoribosylamino)methylideneamino]imidazole-4-carboxamide isomerase [Chloroflexi bacterium]|nr:1-(5-phosphoribosyl)-5-[(5-phosphoribosylamino)methylideneamino]imidazole-4-carboxamide isomerase [Chloroflexota bacterium]